MGWGGVGYWRSVHEELPSVLLTSPITDGAPAYPKGARECQIDHDYASHSKGQFAKWIKKRTTKNQHQHRHDRSVLERTKKNIPNGLTTQSPWLLVYARCWQWRYINMCKDMLNTTAKAVQQALLGWTVPISTGRRKKMTHRHSLHPLFSGLAKQEKKIISTERND